MTAYYNEHDPHAAAWLRELIKAGLIAPGEVDERSIKDVAADDVRGFAQCHWFAGIGGWSHALRLAGWPDDRPVWTGSCPCQPYSSAGKGEGDADPRNLWPEFYRLIRECRPVVVFGEQVESAIRHGWLDGVCRDLEGEGYAVGAVVLGAHSVGAPHIRQRLYWVADTGCSAGERDSGELPPEEAGEQRPREFDGCVPVGSEHGGSVGVALGDANGTGPQGRGVSGCGRAGERAVGAAGGARGNGRVADAGCVERERRADEQRSDAAHPPVRGEEDADDQRRGSTGGFWDAFDLVPCRDGKARRVEPGTFPLAHGVSGRVAVVRPSKRGPAQNQEEDTRWVSRTVALKGFGNAIVPQVAAEFIRAYEDVRVRVDMEGP